MEAAVNEWDEYAADWDTDEAARRYSEAAFTALVERLSARSLSLEGARVIDFGCGTGLLTERLIAAGAQVDAVDTSPAMLAVLDAKIIERGWAGVRTSNELAGLTGPYDLVVCSSVCSFLDDYPATVQRLVADLRPGGLFVQWDWERTEGDETGSGLTRTEVAQALRAAGLGDVSVGIGFTAVVGEDTMSPLMGLGARVGAS